ncbi:MAG: carbohydrate kinase [Chitinivibrionales bacterium]|nr:carbohydrate kinase [Chitinivibrionales bacterium]MBD3357565.1 carbohydrate kinase [Chitinivibrionales bacterium]
MGQAYLLGFDVGSSSVKATLLETATGKAVATATSPKKEMGMIAKQPGWAEQDPYDWWLHVKNAVAEIRETANVNLEDVGAIGISYQMHGLVTVDGDGNPLRPAIIWCDSRAVPYGRQAFEAIGPEKCLKHLLNSPGNFTAAKLAWLKENEPELFGKINKIMLPGDWIAYKLTGRITTTPSGLSEGVLWDFNRNDIAEMVMEHFGFPHDFIPEITPSFAVQGEVTAGAAEETGLRAGTPVAYRGGDQPNNALSLNVLNPGEVAATAGTSGVVYGVGDQTNYDPESRVNTFVHVNHSDKAPRYGILLCVNGTGILNSWLKQNIMTLDGVSLDYNEMNTLAGTVAPGSDGLLVLPFGNGAERTLGNRSIGASVHGLEFNSHTKAHVLRAAQEGIVFALNYGLEVMKSTGVEARTVRAGDANMFMSPIFREAFATLSGARLELYNTDGSRGAARGSGIGAGIYDNFVEAFSGLDTVATVEPDAGKAEAYTEAYGRWKSVLEKTIT